MNQQGEDLMMKSPSSVNKRNLDELGIELKAEKKKKKLLNFCSLNSTCFLTLGRIS